MVVDPAEQPFVAPAAEVAECRAFGRQILRDQAPGNAPAQHVEDGIQDLAGGPGSRATAQGRLRHERGNHRPLRIRQVCFVTKAGAAMLPPGSRGPHGTSRSGFTTRLEAPPSRPINPHPPLSGRALSVQPLPHMTGGDRSILVSVSSETWKALETIAQGRPLEALIAEAIEDYLRKNAMPPAPTS